MATSNTAKKSLRRGVATPASQRNIPIMTFFTPDDLDILQQKKRLARPALLVLRIPGLDPKQSKRWEATLNTRFNACGCATGAVFFFLCLLGAIWWQVISGDWRIESLITFIMCTLALAITGTLLGKFLGIQISRWDLKRIARDIQRHAQLPKTGE